MWGIATIFQPRIGPDGFQELAVVVQGRYRPSQLKAVQGLPARISFLRLERDPCSAWVIFSDFGVELELLPFETVSATFVPDKPGDFLFTCRMGIYVGKLLVIPPRSGAPDSAEAKRITKEVERSGL